MLSAKTEYACLALTRLAAEHAAGLPVQGRRLATEEGIPEGFLVQILQELKRVGLVTSTRGACGGCWCIFWKLRGKAFPDRVQVQ